MDKISVIVPVYRVEKYLDRCVESIVSQTYKNLEIILVDDGSPDNCPKMCDKWAQKDRRIKVIHKKNGGAASARNAALNVLTGEYIGFVDGDDHIENNMYELLLGSLKDTGSDIAICAHFEEDGENIKESLLSYPKRVLPFDECLINVTSNYPNYIHDVLWNKLYKSEVWKGIAFDPSLKSYEDTSVLYRVYSNAKLVSVVDKPLYYYRMNSGGIMHNINKNNEWYALWNKVLSERADYFKEKKNLYDFYIFCNLISWRYAYLCIPKSDNTAKKICKNYYRKNYKILREEKYPLGKRTKIKFKLFEFSPELYSVLLKIRG